MQLVSAIVESKTGAYDGIYCDRTQRSRADGRQRHKNGCKIGEKNYLLDFFDPIVIAIRLSIKISN